MLKMFFDINVVYDIVIIVMIGLAIIATFKSPWGKYFWLATLSIVLLGTGIYSGFEINNYNKARGGIFGAIKSGITHTNVVEVQDLRFDLKDIELTQKDGDNEDLYEAKFLVNEVIKLGNYNSYGIYVNDVPSEITEITTDYMMGRYEYNFYDENKQLILNDTLTFKFAFYKDSSMLLVQTSGGSNAVRLWNYYFNKNSFIVSLLENDAEIQETLAEQLAKVEFSVDNKTIKTIYVLKGNSIIGDIVIDSPKYDVTSWTSDPDGESVVDIKSFKIDSNMTFYGKYSIKEYTVNYYVGHDSLTNKLVKTEKYKYGEFINWPSGLDTSEYRVTGWTCNGTTTEKNMCVYGNLNLNAILGTRVSKYQLISAMLGKMNEVQEKNYSVYYKSDDSYLVNAYMVDNSTFKIEILNTTFINGNLYGYGKMTFTWNVKNDGTINSSKGLADVFYIYFNKRDEDPYTLESVKKNINELFTSSKIDLQINESIDWDGGIPVNPGLG